MACIRVHEMISFKKDLVLTAAGDWFLAPKKILHVTYNEFQLELTVYQDRNHWYPATFYHNSNLECPFCKGHGYSECSMSEQRVDGLYQEIIESKPFRLQALFDL